MFLSRILLPEDGAGLWDHYSSHQMVWSWFHKGERAERDFLHRIEGNTVWTLSKHELSPRSTLRVESKRFEPRLSKGDRLQFLTTVNPRVDKNGKKHDAVMHWMKQHDVSRDEATPNAMLQWFERRGVQNGFSLQEFEASGYRPLYVKRGAKICSVDAQGVFTVTEPGSFLDMITKGIGGAKAFGCGLLLIRRVS